MTYWEKAQIQQVRPNPPALRSVSAVFTEALAMIFVFPNQRLDRDSHFDTPQRGIHP